MSKQGFICPILECNSRRGDYSGLRTHLNTEHVGVAPTSEWLQLSGSKMCPGCGTGVVALRTSFCKHCPVTGEPKAPKLVHLPELPPKRCAPQVSLHTVESKSSVPSWEGSKDSIEVKVDSLYDSRLLSICFANAPQLKSVPKREASLFAKTWAGLLCESLQRKECEPWADFFRFPKCILLAPVRGGRRISRSQPITDLVTSRIAKWSESKESRETLWQAC